MKELTGTLALIRLILRRDRILLPVWIIAIAVLPVGIASAFAQLYSTQEGIQAFIQGLMGSPAELALLGPVFAPTIGGLTAWRWGMAGGILIGLASAFTIIRHTRAEEQAGRRELIGSTVVGRHAALTAALIVTFAADLVLGFIAAGGLISLGLPVEGSLALGLSATLIGWTIASMAAVIAQLTEGAGAARAIIGGLLGALYLVRAVGDAGGENGPLAWLSWLSPLGWLHLVRPYAGEVWWVLGLFLGSVVVLGASAYALAAGRDMGAGLFRPRPGRAAGAPSLRSPLALAWRLQRGLLLPWIAAYAAIGAVFGFIGQTAVGQLSSNQQVMDILARLGGNAGYVDIFFTAALMLICGEVAAVYAIQAALKLRTEELEGRADPVLAASVSRIRWAGSHLFFMLTGSARLLATFGLVAGLTYGLSTGDVGREVPRVLIASLAYLPSVWILGGIAAALFGLLPRVTVLSWAALAMVLLIDLLGELFRAPQTVLDLSPFVHVPKLLINQGATSPLIWLSLIAAALVLTGLAGFRRREVG